MNSFSVFQYFLLFPHRRAVEGVNAALFLYLATFLRYEKSGSLSVSSFNVLGNVVEDKGRRGEKYELELYYTISVCAGKAVQPFSQLFVYSYYFQWPSSSLVASFQN